MANTSPHFLSTNIFVLTTLFFLFVLQEVDLMLIGEWKECYIIQYANPSERRSQFDNVHTIIHRSLIFLIEYKSPDFNRLPEWSAPGCIWVFESCMRCHRSNTIVLNGVDAEIKLLSMETSNHIRTHLLNNTKSSGSIALL